MLEWIETSPKIEVRDEEYRRLLGFPAEHELTDRAIDLMHRARSWYVQNGAAWIHIVGASVAVRGKDQVLLADTVFHNARLATRLIDNDAKTAAIVAVSAGAELEQQANRSWQSGLPDEYFFFEIFGSAVVEALIAQVGAQLCRWAESQSATVLRHESPGCGNWDIAEQVLLLRTMKQLASRTFTLDQLEVLESGMLKPKKSQIAVFGISMNTVAATDRFQTASCSSCSLAGCEFRRPGNPSQGISQTGDSDAATAS